MKGVLSNKINTINKYLSFKRSLEISRKEIFAIYSIFENETSNLWSKSYLKDGKKSIFFKEIFKKLYDIFKKVLSWNLQV